MPLIIDGILLCVGLYWLAASVATLPLWKGMSLGGGLLPTIASAIMVLLLIVKVARTFKREKINKAYFQDSIQAINWKELAPLAIGLLILVGNRLIGLFLSLTIMLFCWLKFLSHYSVKRSALVTAGVMLFLFCVFKLWLKLPLPKGLLGLV